MKLQELTKNGGLKEGESERIGVESFRGQQILTGRALVGDRFGRAEPKSQPNPPFNGGCVGQPDRPRPVFHTYMWYQHLKQCGHLNS